MVSEAGETVALPHFVVWALETIILTGTAKFCKEKIMNTTIDDNINWGCAFVFFWLSNESTNTLQRFHPTKTNPLP